MQEIAATFRDLDLPAGFHEASGQVFAMLADTPWAHETRETLDRSRTLEQTLRTLAKPRG